MFEKDPSFYTPEMKKEIFDVFFREKPAMMLVELKNAYEGLESVKAASASRQVPDLTEEEVAELSTIVVKLRNQIVK